MSTKLQSDSPITKYNYKILYFAYIIPSPEKGITLRNIKNNFTYTELKRYALP